MIGKLVVLVTFLCYVISLEFADGRELVTKHKGTIKTIKSENGEVIDCVDIYKQPAFDHPFLKNHKIKIWPRKVEDGNEKLTLSQAWNKNGEYCPDGSIPILRSSKTDYHVKLTKDINVISDDRDEYAVARFLGRNHGGSAILNVWNPIIEKDELSLAEVRVESGDRTVETNTIGAGWSASYVDPKKSESKVFVYWSRDNDTHTGCYNMECPGFVQVSSKIALGATLEPISTYYGDQFEILVRINKEGTYGGTYGDWWIEVQGERLGYYPRAIVPQLGFTADVVQWGGKITNMARNSRHTSTQMGSGHFPVEGFKRASYFKNLQIHDLVDNTFKDPDPQSFSTLATKPLCYDIKADRSSDSGTFFYYGGPGYSDKCKI